MAQAIELFRDLGSRHGLAMALNTGGELAARTSAAEEARRYHSEALAIAKKAARAPWKPGRCRESAAACCTAIRRKPPGTCGTRWRSSDRSDSPDAQGVQDTLDEYGL